jgi:hypothetical protein
VTFTVDEQLFLKNCSNEFHRNPAKDLVADIR